ncbi:hypothetical protein B0H14DRAFT_3472514 [Mycena olivaceomarginata]|nr:hypothetical protein B0H14DRAFT_3472514 [Mycena olivaceomarginata]
MGPIFDIHPQKYGILAHEIQKARIPVSRSHAPEIKKRLCTATRATKPVETLTRVCRHYPVHLILCSIADFVPKRVHTLNPGMRSVSKYYVALIICIHIQWQFIQLEPAVCREWVISLGILALTLVALHAEDTC